MPEKLFKQQLSAINAQIINPVKNGSSPESEKKIPPLNGNVPIVDTMGSFMGGKELPGTIETRFMGRKYISHITRRCS